MSELLPCPFCGGENIETSYKDTFSGDFRRGVYCADCCGGIYPYYGTEAEAVEAWNTRAERTCEIVRVGNTRDVRKCSACNKLMHFDHPLDRDCLNYCPNCGCMVIDERE